VIDKTYWLDDRGFYAFATKERQSKPSVAEAGPERARRQKRLDELSSLELIDEDTVLPAVPLWFRAADDARAQREIDRLGSGSLATDWGVRLLSADSALYDPLSYHYGSVWPLFTGWASMAAYRYGRPHVGYQALMANANLTFTGALGDVTELLSGDFHAPFGRSSHHQIWSQAMVVTPFVRGLLGIEVASGGRELRFAPQLPADWDQASVTNVAAGDSRYDFRLERNGKRMTITGSARSAGGSAPSVPSRLVISPAFPLDATVRSVTVNGRRAPFKMQRMGDVQQAHLTLDNPSAQTTIQFEYVDGTDVYRKIEMPASGADNSGLRILRSTATTNQLRLVVEGRGGKSYTIFVRTPRRVADAPGVKLTAHGRDVQAEIAFEGPSDRYVRREVVLPLTTR
jgi:hypothetical protein